MKLTRNRRINEKAYLTDKIWYHGSREPIESFKNTNTLTFLGSLGFVKKFAEEEHINHVYKCRLKKSANLFESTNPEDLENLKQYVEANDVSFSGNRFCLIPYYLSDTKEIFNWKGYFRLIGKTKNYIYLESEGMLELIINMKYDGIVVTEDNLTNIAVFDGSLIEIIEEIYFDRF